MLCFQKPSVRIVSHVVAALSMLPCLSVASCCCVMGNIECGGARKAYYFDASFGPCGRMAWSYTFKSQSQCLNGGQNSKKYGCNCPCCGGGPHTCNGVQSGITCNCRKKPTGSARQSFNGSSAGQKCPPTSRIAGVPSWAPSVTSTTDRCSLLCRFLL